MSFLKQFCVTFSQSFENTQIRLNKYVQNNKVGKYFKLEERGTCFTRELRAATTTFLAMVYVIAIISTVLSDTGGTCPVSDWPGPKYESCKNVVKNDLIVSISLTAMMGCFLMGLLANLPFGLACGTGPSMYMAYNLVGLHGSGPMSYENALGLWMVEALCFLIISGTGLRSKLGRVMPVSVRLACGVGIGFFIAFIGLQAHQGVGLIGPDPTTLVTITACAKVNPITGACEGKKLNSPRFWIGLMGFLIMSFGLAHKIKGSMMYGILFVTFISWFRNTSVTYFPNTDVGDQRYKYFKKVVDFHKIHKIAGKISFTEFSKGKTWVSLLMLLYIDLLSTTGGLYTLAQISGFVDGQGSFENEYVAYMIDAGTTLFACVLGVPPIATYSESLAGVKEGGRTGLTAVLIGVYFLMSLFFAPLLTSVPPWAIGPSLVMIGVIMMKVAKDIDWGNVREAVPAFVTIILMPLTSSIPNGIIAGIGIHVVLHLYDWVALLVRRVIDFRRTDVPVKIEGDNKALEYDVIDNVP
ncbi:hypothetical protein RND81_05G234200 [Saponaria officinalis]|uniref:Uncharacterized protein n=1 Tax=Saponaria officinalis TaxID=3572 RepID=A0AAW1L015_SAPOF